MFQKRKDFIGYFVIDLKNLVMTNRNDRTRKILQETLKNCQSRIISRSLVGSSKNKTLGFSIRILSK